jgi:hypothetical protein
MRVLDGSVPGGEIRGVWTPHKLIDLSTPDVPWTKKMTNNYVHLVRLVFQSEFKNDFNTLFQHSKAPSTIWITALSHI